MMSIESNTTDFIFYFIFGENFIFIFKKYSIFKLVEYENLANSTTLKLKKINL